MSKNYKYLQVSMVNGISTIRGGKHVDNIINQVVKKLTEASNKKKKKLEIKPSYVKENIWLFVKCIIEEPTFDGQTKESMTTNINNFGSKWLELLEIPFQEVQLSFRNKKILYIFL